MTNKKIKLRAAAMIMMMCPLLCAHITFALNVPEDSHGNSIRFTMQNGSASFPIFVPYAECDTAPAFVTNIPALTYAVPSIVGPGETFELEFHFDIAAGTMGQEGDLVLLIGSGHEVFATRVFHLVVAAPCACDCFGDPVNCPDVVDVFDVVACVDEAFRNGPPVIDPNVACPYTDNNVNCDNVVDVFDVVAMVDVAFRSADPAAVFCDPCP